MVEAQRPRTIAPAQGKLGVMLVGLGAVSTTFIAGVENVRRQRALPIGSVSQLATIRLGKRTENRHPKIKDFVPLARLEDLVFAAWDPIPDDAYTAAKKAGVLESEHIEPIAEFLRGIRPMPAAFDQNYVKRLTGTNLKQGRTKRELADQVRADIQRFKQEQGVDRVVVVWCASTEIFITPGPAHENLAAFERAMEQNDAAIAPSMLYAWAALMEGVPFANGAPNLTLDIPALTCLAEERRVPIGGKDFKTGQTMMKTVLAPAFKARMLGLAGWYSTNILGNRDGEVLDDPESFKTKEESKLGVLEYILEPSSYPELYGNVYHKVRINYYPPRGDNKEGWDNIDIFGWRLPDADQSRFPVPRFDSGRADRARPGVILRSVAACRVIRHPGVALLLFQEPAARAGSLSRARPVHPADQAEKHPPVVDGRRADHPSGGRILRVRREVTRDLTMPRGDTAR
jgi:myo-inositol-1-phosphate synthase